MKKMLIAGNWKMNTDIESTANLLDNISTGLKNVTLSSEVLVCPPFTNLETAVRFASGSKVKVGAQNCHPEPKGAFTGEISVSMIARLGCSHVILGHSERRKYFGESDEFINLKAKAVSNAGMTPVVCIGETLEERQTGKTFDVLASQIKGSLAGLGGADNRETVVAYEPVWAIGTGLAATPEQIDEAHNFIRERITETLGEVGKSTAILYGGSVTDDNAAEILAINNVNGALIGGASLKAESFLSIIKTSETIIGTK